MLELNPVIVLLLCLVKELVVVVRSDIFQRYPANSTLNGDCFLLPSYRMHSISLYRVPSILNPIIVVLLSLVKELVVVLRSDIFQGYPAKLVVLKKNCCICNLPSINP